MECSEDADCIDRYGQDGYVCDADSSACLYRKCYTDSDCDDSLYCTTDSSDCTDGC